jgi:two-component system, NtrC family, sensor kinase
MKKLILLRALLFVVWGSTNGQDRTIDSLEKVLLTQKEDTNKANTMHELGYNYHVRGNIEKAMQNAYDALAYSQKIGYQKGILRGYWAVGLVTSQNLYDYETALKYFNEGLKLSEQINDQQNIVAFNIRISHVYYNLSNYPEALKYSLSALKISENLHDKIGMAEAYLNISTIYEIQSNYAEALRYNQLSLKVREQATEQEKAFRFYNVTEHHSMIAQTYSAIAVDYLAMDEVDLAVENAMKALELYTKLGESELKMPLTNTYSTIGSIYTKKGDIAATQKDSKSAKKYYAEAIDYCMKAQTIANKMENKGSLSSILNINTGRIYFKLNKFALADSFLSIGLKRFEDLSGNFDLKQYGYFYKSQLDSMNGDWLSAYNNHKKYAQYKDSLTNEDKIKSITTQQMQFEFDKKNALSKAEQEKKDIEQKRIRNLQYIFLVGLLLLVSGLYYNNRQKQKAKTEIEKAYSVLKATQAQLIQSEKLASLGELTAGIAHEIQNPLNFVNNFSELSVDLAKELNTEIDKELIDKGLVKDILSDLSSNQEKINHHGKRASNIVKGMLEHSRASTGVKELTDINKLADEYLRLSYHGLRAKDKDFNADFSTEFEDNLPKLSVIPQDLGRVLLNLINNAFYAVNQRQQLGSSFKLEPSYAENYTPSVFVSTQQLENQIIIKVKDNGTGMSESVKAKIFQPFFTTKPTGQGTGLGLSLAYDIVTKGHGGELRVETKEGEGSTFIIQLPIKE